jgi:hypothetical protein
LVCVGSDYEVLPDRSVLADFLRHGWRVLVTTKRIASSKPTTNRPLELAGRKTTPYYTDSHDLHITWSESSGLVFEPSKAELVAEELFNYQSVSDSKKRS